MKEYGAMPNKDVSGWYVKMEDAAVLEAEGLARENAPSKLIICDA